MPFATAAIQIHKRNEILYKCEYSSVLAFLRTQNLTTRSIISAAPKIANPIAYLTPFFASPPRISTHLFDLPLSKSPVGHSVEFAGRHLPVSQQYPHPSWSTQTRQFALCSSHFAPRAAASRQASMSLFR